MVDNLPRRLSSRSELISDDTMATVVPFAQQEMVHSFMNGIDPRLQESMRKSTAALFFGAFDQILQTLTTAPVSGTTVPPLSALRPKLTELVEALYRDWDGMLEAFWNPVVTNISNLPKDELAAMAEAFVNLTKFRRRVANERETVGGPIDVAVITKGDGFIWVKRKHYFDPALNPRFVGRYFKGEKQ